MLRADTFGNLILDATAEQLAALGAMPGDDAHRAATQALCARVRYAATFAEVTPGGLLLYEDARGCSRWPSTAAPPPSCSAPTRTTS